MSYVCAIDTGGTFTDCVVLDMAGELVQAKAPSTPEDFSRGAFNSIEAAVAQLGLTIEKLLEQTTHLLIGTTVGTNAIVQGRGATVGMLTTRGHGDVLSIMRGHGRVAGRPPSEALAPFRTSKPEPLVPRAQTIEIDERVDCFGEVVVTLDPEQVLEAAKQFRSLGVESVAVCFLWSFLNAEHELTSKAILSEETTLFVSASSEVAPRWGEYERWAGAAMNAYLGPLTARYLDGIALRLQDHGYAGQLLLMACNGGSLPIEEAKRLPLLLLGSGPVGGISGSVHLSRLLGIPNMIATDMGGTSFDVGLIHDSEPVRSMSSAVGGYEFFVRNVEVRSIGSGGGSIAWVETSTNRLRVGPQSAGALPGPACYNRGGADATVTDANVVLGLVNPDYFLAGAMRLDVAAARRAIDSVAAQLDMDPVATADGIVQISNGHMVDLLRKLTIERGFHPEDFVLLSYGGAGGLHSCAYARELGIARVIVPLANAASVWSAFGIASSDILHIFESTQIDTAPFDVHAVSDRFGRLERRARAQLSSEGLGPSDIVLQRRASFRYKMQVHELEVPLPAGPLEQRHLEAAIEAFEHAYEQRYGKGSGYREAGFELVSLAVEATGRLKKPALAPSSELDRESPSAVGRRPVYWRVAGGFLETPIYRTIGDVTIEGPAVIELPATTIALHPKDTCNRDKYGNLLIEISQ